MMRTKEVVTVIVTVIEESDIDIVVTSFHLFLLLSFHILLQSWLENYETNDTFSTKSILQSHTKSLNFLSGCSESHDSLDRKYCKS